MTVTTLRAPEWVIAQASKALGSYRKRRVFAKRMYATGWLSLAVIKRWRLLSKNGGKDWQLMSHEKYSSEINKR